MQWDKWLEESPELSEKLIKIRTSVERIYKNKGAVLKYYTPHGVEHCQAVEDLIHKLIPDEKPPGLTLRERFYLLASAWLHDLGMLPALAKELFPSKNYEMSEIRKIHHIISAEYVTNKWKEVGVDESDRTILANLCRFHRKQEDIDDCDENPTIYFGEKVKLRLLAAYLRLADSLDIGPSRTPFEPYSICLTYDIPLDAKVHWIKSNLVHDIEIKPNERKIIVIFREPWNMQDSSTKLIRDKMDSIKRTVLKEFRNELLPLVNVFIRHSGMPIYLDVEKADASVALDIQTQNDLREFISNYDILTDPSASKLVEMILVSSANILGYSLSKCDEVVKMIPLDIHDDDDKKIHDKLENFIKSLKEGPLKTRPCHLGLLKIVNELDTNKGKDIKAVAQQIQELFRAHHDSRNKVRKNSEVLFKSDFDEFGRTTSCINILLYGYSELVTKAICGFRDALIKVAYPNIEPRQVRGHRDELQESIETKISKRINLFICDGQPKTQTDIRDRLIYHDGSQYSLHLTRRNFRNIVMIPDAIAGHVIDDESLPIHFVIVGANGITDSYFRHSAGHSSIVNLAREYRDRQKEQQRFPYILLVVSKEKYLTAPSVVLPNASTCPFENIGTSPHVVDGSLFLARKNISSRESVWLLKDKELLDNLRANDIYFYNPREDVIPISHIDYLLSDFGYINLSANRHKPNVVKEHFSQVVA